MWPSLTKQGTSRSDKFLIKYESTVQAIFIRYNPSVHSYLEAVELAYNNQGLYLTIIKGVTHERTPSMLCGIVFGWMHRVVPILVVR